MNDAASFDAIMQCNLLEVFCEALGAAIFVTDRLDQITFASIRLLHFYPIRQNAIEPGGRALCGDVRRRLPLRPGRQAERRHP